MQLRLRSGSARFDLASAPLADAEARSPARASDSRGSSDRAEGGGGREGSECREDGGRAAPFGGQEAPDVCAGESP